MKLSTTQPPLNELRWKPRLQLTSAAALRDQFCEKWKLQDREFYTLEALLHSGSITEQSQPLTQRQLGYCPLATNLLMASTIGLFVGAPATMAAMNLSASLIFFVQACIFRALVRRASDPAPSLEAVEVSSSGRTTTLFGCCARAEAGNHPPQQPQITETSNQPRELHDVERRCDMAFSSRGENFRIHGLQTCTPWLEEK